MLVFPQVLNVKAPISMMMLFGGDALGYIIIRTRLGHEGGDFTKWNYCPYKLSPMRGYSKKVAICKPGYKTPPDAPPVGTLILDFQPLKLWETNIFYLSHPVYVCLLWQPKQIRTSGNNESRDTALSSGDYLKGYHLNVETPALYTIPHTS